MFSLGEFLGDCLVTTLVLQTPAPMFGCSTRSHIFLQLQMSSTSLCIIEVCRILLLPLLRIVLSSAGKTFLPPVQSLSPLTQQPYYIGDYFQFNNQHHITSVLDCTLIWSGSGYRLGSSCLGDPGLHCGNSVVSISKERCPRTV